jgi:hypothetical protein
MDVNSGAQDLENRVRQQVEQILSEIRATPPAARRPGESLSFEDVAVATARAVIPALLVDLPLEMERLIRQASDAAGVKPEERVELLRLIVTRLASEWTELAERLAGRLDSTVEASGDAEAVRSLKEEVLQKFREGRPWTVLLGGPAPAAEPGRRKAAPPVTVAEDMAVKIAESVSRKIEASQTAAPPAPAPAALPPDLAERVAEVTANTLKSGVLGDLRKDLAEIQDVSARSEAIRAVLRAELERVLGTMSQSAFRPDEIRMISTHIAHTLGGTLTNWIFGPPRPAERVRAPRASRPRKAARRRPRRAAPARPGRAAKAAPRRRPRKAVAKPEVRKPAPRKAAQARPGKKVSARKSPPRKPATKKPRGPRSSKKRAAPKVLKVLPAKTVFGGMPRKKAAAPARKVLKVLPAKTVFGGMPKAPSGKKAPAPPRGKTLARSRR